MPRITSTRFHKEAGRFAPSHMNAAHGNGQVVHKRHTLRVVFLVLFFAIISLLVIATYQGYKLYQQALVVKTHEEKAVSLIREATDKKTLQNPDTMATLIPKIQKETNTARQIAHGSLWRSARLIPVYGDDIKTVQGMVDTVDDLSQSTLPELSTTISHLAKAKFNEGDGQVNLIPIKEAGTGLYRTDKLLKQQLASLKEQPRPKIAGIRKQYDYSVHELSHASVSITKISSNIQVLPQFLGSQGKRTYLIAAQTPAEARSAGGLIGSIGTLDADNGKVKVNDFHPDAEFFGLAAGGTPEEEALFSYPTKFSFDIRDLTANPDFSHTAQAINQRWQNSVYAGQVDGVIMIDPVFIQEVIKINGDVKVAGNLTLNGTNTAQYFMNTIYKTVSPGYQDQVFSDVAQQAMNGVFTDLNAQKLLAMARIINPMTSSRHLYAFTFHSDEAKYFQGAGLAKDAPKNEEQPEIGIYLNQNNSSKLDWYLQRNTEITHKGCNSTGVQSYHVRFTMTNTITQKDMHTGNEARDQYLLGGSSTLGYSRGSQVERILLYPPAGGSITNITNNGNGSRPTLATLNGKSLYHSLVTIAPGASVTYEYDVTTSARATTTLKLDQTPTGWTDPGIRYDNEPCQAH